VKPDVRCPESLNSWTEQLQQQMVQTAATLSEYLLGKANRRFGFPKRIDPGAGELLSSVAESLFNDNLGPIVKSEKAHQVPEGFLDWVSGRRGSAPVR
jgi:hypothetical protein